MKNQAGKTEKGKVKENESNLYSRFGWIEATA